jgi:D-arabinose 1-dehydrogenase-like Zn-dependent alcohol dehydrogenase
VAVVSSTREKERQAREMGAELFIHAGSEPAGTALAAWDGGADIILVAAPAPEVASAAFSGLAPDGTMVLLAPVPVSVDPLALGLRRQRLMGSPSGSRKELRATLDIAASHNIRPQRKCLAFANAAEALAELESARPAGRLVLILQS